MDIQTRAAIEKELVSLIKLVDGYQAVSILKNINTAVLAGVDVYDISKDIDRAILEKQSNLHHLKIVGGNK